MALTKTNTEIEMYKDYHKILYYMSKEIKTKMNEIESYHDTGKYGSKVCIPQDCIKCASVEDTIEYRILRRLQARHDLKDIKSIY